MRIIVHVDMDAFYAAVEKRMNPALRDLPVVVGANPKEGKGRGVVTTANYRAREFGIRSALPISRAWRLAEAARSRGEPATIFLLPNMSLYREASGRIMQILQHYADAFEEASIDEAYLDVSSLENFAAVRERVLVLKGEIRDREGLGCSVGIGPNRLIAKIASGRHKPDGLTVVEPEQVAVFLGPLPIRVIPGIGPKSEHFLREKQIRTIDDLRRLPEAVLVNGSANGACGCSRKSAASMTLTSPTNGRENRSASRKRSRRILEIRRPLSSVSTAWRNGSSPS